MKGSGYTYSTPFALCPWYRIYRLTDSETDELKKMIASDQERRRGRQGGSEEDGTQRASERESERQGSDTQGREYLTAACLDQRLCKEQGHKKTIALYFTQSET